MNKIKCIIVDDEPPAISILEKYIADIPMLELQAAMNNAMDANIFLQDHQVDLLFLDIQMPGLLGTAFIRALRNPPAVVFTTAHRQFAVEGFDLEAVDYLLKPVSFDRFVKAVNRVLAIREIGAGIKSSGDNGQRMQKESIVVRADRKNLRVPLDTILFIESLRDYIKIVTLTGQIVCKQSISSIESLLPAEGFIRIHRSYIVAIDKISSYTHELVEIHKQELPVSRMYRMEVEKVLAR